MLPTLVLGMWTLLGIGQIPDTLQPAFNLCREFKGITPSALLLQRVQFSLVSLWRGRQTVERRLRCIVLTDQP